MWCGGVGGGRDALLFSGEALLGFGDVVVGGIGEAELVAVSLDIERGIAMGAAFERVGGLVLVVR